MVSKAILKVWRDSFFICIIPQWGISAATAAPLNKEIQDTKANKLRVKLQIYCECVEQQEQQCKSAGDYCKNKITKTTYTAWNWRDHQVSCSGIDALCLVLSR